jgi:hypothetical protein
MQESLYLPALLIISLSIGTAMELVDVAEVSAAKAVAYSEDMTVALDCAYTARPLDECSPDLFSTDFTEEADRTRAILEDLREQQAGAKLKRHS